MQKAVSALKHSTFEKLQQNKRTSNLFRNLFTGNNPLVSYSGKKLFSFHFSLLYAHTCVPVSSHTHPPSASISHLLCLILAWFVSSKDLQPLYKCFTKKPAFNLNSQRENWMQATLFMILNFINFNGLYPNLKCWRVFWSCSSFSKMY